MYESYVESISFKDAMAPVGHAHSEILKMSFGVGWGTGIPLSDGSILTADHVRMVMFGKHYFEGREYEPRRIIFPPNDIEFKRYIVPNDEEYLKDGLFRFYVPEVEPFARSFEFDLHKIPRPLTNEEFDAKYPPGTRVTLSGYARNPSFVSRDATWFPGVKDAWVLRHISTSLIELDAIPYSDRGGPDDPDFLAMVVPHDYDLRGMSGGAVTAVDSEGTTRLLGVFFYTNNTTVSLFGVDLQRKTPKVALAFRWPYESRLIDSP